MDDVDKLINGLFSSLNKLNNNKKYLTVRIINLSNELYETLKILESCSSCKKYMGRYIDKFYKPINDIEKFSLEEEGQKKGKIIYELDCRLAKVDYELNKVILHECCKEKKIDKLTDKCQSEKVARLLDECRQISDNNNSCIQWISFNEFTNIGYLAKGGFGEVDKATWIKYDRDSTDMKCVVLKRLHNNNTSDKISDILEEVKF